MHIEEMKSTFHCNIEKGSLAPSPNVGPTFQNFSIITEWLADAKEIDCDDLFSPTPHLQDIASEIDLSNISDSDSDSHSEQEDTPANEKNMESVENHPSTAGTRIPRPGPPKGYEYMLFEPKDIPREPPGHMQASPTQQTALSALQDVTRLI